MKTKSFSPVAFSTMSVQLPITVFCFNLKQLLTLVDLFLIAVSSVGSGHVYRSYHTSFYCNALSEIQFPPDTASLLIILQSALARGQKVKAFGSRHSITDIICTEGIPISMENFAYAQINNDMTATFGAGIKLGAAMEFLQSKNLSLIHVPAFHGISIGGAIGTGAHGSSLRHAATLSDQVVRLTVMTGNGTVLKISGLEVDIFRVHLGLLGIIIDVTFQTVPLYKMTIQNEVKGDSVLFDGSIHTDASNHDMYQVSWFPHTRRVVVATGKYVSLQTFGNAELNFIPRLPKQRIRIISSTYELLQRVRSTQGLNTLASLTELSLYTKAVGLPPLYIENGRNVNPATGCAWRLQSNACDGSSMSKCPWDGDDGYSINTEDSSMAFDLSQFTGVMQMMQSILKRHPAAFPLWGVVIRFVKPSPANMAISSQRKTFVVEWLLPMRKNPFETSRDSIGTYQAILQEMITNYGGWTHWGKSGLYYTSKEILASSNPNRRQFITAMRKYDPQGTFLNAFGQRMLGISNAQDRDPRVTHCALQDYCICSSNSDCAAFQRCDKINGFNVCMDYFNLKGFAAFPGIHNFPRAMYNITLQVKEFFRAFRVF